MAGRTLENCDPEVKKRNLKETEAKKKEKWELKHEKQEWKRKKFPECTSSVWLYPLF